MTFGVIGHVTLACCLRLVQNVILIRNFAFKSILYSFLLVLLAVPCGTVFKVKSDNGA